MPVSQIPGLASRQESRTTPFVYQGVEGQVLGTVNKAGRLAAIKAEITRRMDVCPAFFTLAGDSPEKWEAFWRQTQESYLDNKLPCLFKERLCAYLSRFCRVPYCVVRHAGFLLGWGNIAGNAGCKPRTLEEVLILLKMPFPSPQEWQPCHAVLAARKSPLRVWPSSGGQLETCLLVCAASVFLGRGDHEVCLRELRRLLGPARCEQLLSLLAYNRFTHFWMETHPELQFESDLRQMLAQTPALADYLCGYSDRVREELVQADGRGVSTSRHAPLPPPRGAARGQREPSRPGPLCQSEARFARLVQTAPVAIVIHDREGRIVQCNATAERMLGVSRQNVRSRTLGEETWRFLREDGTPMPVEEFPVAQVLARRATAAEMVVGVRQANGKGPSWMLVHASPTLADDGSVAEVVVVFMDITRHKRAEDALRQTQLLNQRITDVIPAVIYVHDVVNNRPLFASHQVVKALGFSPELTAELMLRSLDVLIHPDDRDGMDRHHGRLKHLADTEFIDIDYRLCHGDGDWHWFQARDAVFARDEAGEVTQIIGCALDVTERKRAEEALRASEERLRQSELLQHAIIDALPAQLAVVDRKGSIIAVNDAWLRFAVENGGADLPSVQVGANYLDVCRRAAAEREPGAGEALAGIESVLSGESQEFSYEYPCDCLDKQRWFCMTVVPLRLGMALGAVVSHVNITARREAEQALRECEERFRIVAEKAQACFGIVQGRRFVYANSYLEQLSGYTPEELLSMEFVELVHPGYRQQVMDLARQRQSGGAAPDHYEFAMVTKGGQTRWIDFAAGRCAYRGLPAVVGTGFDITERKRAEAALRESEERFRLATKATHDVFWDFNPANGIINWNENYSALFGRPLEAADARGWWMGPIHPDDRERVLVSFREAIEGTGQVWIAEYRLKRADGQWAFVDNHAYIVRDDSSRVRRVFGAMRDLTHRKVAEQALRRSEERFRLVQSVAGVGTWERHLESGQVIWDPEMERMFGYEPGDFPGTYAGFTDRVHPADLERFERERDQAVAAHRDFNLDFRALLPSGESRWINIRGGTAYDAAGKPERFFGASVDITARKQTEHQLAASLRDLRKAQKRLMRRERLAALGQLAGTLAHELRSPLAVIHNAAFFLDQALPQGDATVQQVLAEITRAVGKSNQIITEMLEYVREPSPHSTAVPVGSLIESALKVEPLPETIRFCPPVPSKPPPRCKSTAIR